MMRALIPLTATVLVVVALARLPYGYYMLLRSALCAACVYCILAPRPPLSFGHRFALGCLAGLYNPLFPVHLRSKGLWTLVNIATVLYLWFIDRRREAGVAGGT